jgi:hypothetical protein
MASLAFHASPSTYARIARKVFTGTSLLTPFWQQMVNRARGYVWG